MTEKEGVYELKIAPQTCLALQPLELLFVGEGETRLRAALGANGRLTLIERHSAQGAGKLRIEILLSEQAKLVHGRVVLGDAKGGLFIETKAEIAGGAFYDAFSLIADGAETKCETDVFLKGELAATKLSGTTLLRGSSRAAVSARVFHETPHGTSRQTFKGVLDDKAKAAFNGRIHVAKEAQKTDGYQLSRALLLSDKAEMNAKPELEIYADDVKCSHGSAIGDLSEEELFYLRSRGIAEKEARAMLIEAFVNEETDKIPSPDLAALVREEVKTWLRQ